MDDFLYQYFGYNKEYVLNKKAFLIQKTYKNYKDYKFKKTQDYIKYFSLFNNKSSELLEHENKEEIDYWNNQRKLIKKKILGDYIIIGS